MILFPWYQQQKQTQRKEEKTMKTKKYNSVIKSITVNINPVFHDVLYIIEYSSGKKRYIFQDELSYDFSQRIHNFIDSGSLVLWEGTQSKYKYGLQNVIA